jgi:DNA transformation protein
MAKKTSKAGTSPDTSHGPKHSRHFADFVFDLLAPLGPVQMSRLFSGHGFKLDGVNFAMLLRSTLFLRVDEALAADMDKAGAKPFRYSTSQRSVTVASYRGVPEDRLDDADTVLEWARRAVVAAKAAPKRKKKTAARSG